MVRVRRTKCVNILCLLEPCSHIVSFATTGIAPDTSSSACCTHSFAPGDAADTKTIIMFIVTMMTSHALRFLFFGTYLDASLTTNYPVHTMHMKRIRLFLPYFFPASTTPVCPEGQEGRGGRADSERTARRLMRVCLTMVYYVRLNVGDVVELKHRRAYSSWLLSVDIFSV